MLNRILPLINKYVPTALAAKGLEKVDSRFGKFIQAGLASGYSMDSVIDYVRGQFGNEGLGEQQGNLRPDQLAANTAIRQSKTPGKLLQGAASIGAGTLGGTAALASGLIGGMDEQQQSIQQSPQQSLEQEPSQSQQQGNIIAQYSPELHNFLEGEISKGRHPVQAGALAYLDSKFKGVISKIQKDTGLKWEDILQQTYLGNQRQQQQPTEQSQQTVQGQQALMSILQKLQQGRGNK